LSDGWLVGITTLSALGSDKKICPKIIIYLKYYISEKIYYALDYVEH